MLAELVEVRHRYAEGIDHCDWNLFRSVFCDEVEVSMMTSADSPPPERRLLDADRWVADVAELVSGLRATQHCMFQARCEGHGDTATLTTYMQAEHVLDLDDPTGHYTIGGYYLDGLQRTAGAWRIASLELSLFWHRGDPGVLREALARARSGARPVRADLRRARGSGSPVSTPSSSSRRRSRSPGVR